MVSFAILPVQFDARWLFLKASKRLELDFTEEKRDTVSFKCCETSLDPVVEHDSQPADAVCATIQWARGVWLPHRSNQRITN
jgi:hypothetical protein